MRLAETPSSAAIMGTGNYAVDKALGQPKRMDKYVLLATALLLACVNVNSLILHLVACLISIRGYSPLNRVSFPRELLAPNADLEPPLHTGVYQTCPFLRLIRTIKYERFTARLRNRKCGQRKAARPIVSTDNHLGPSTG